VFYLFAAVLAWQLGGLPAETLVTMRVTEWALALCFATAQEIDWAGRGQRAAGTCLTGRLFLNFLQGRLRGSTQLRLAPDLLKSPLEVSTQHK
jgi:hypothetical protein